MSALNYARLLSSNGVESFCLATEDSSLVQKAQLRQVRVETVDSGLSWLKKVSRIREVIKSEGVSTVFVHRLKDLQLLYPALIGCKNVEVVGFAHMLLKVSKKDPLHRLFYSRLRTLVAFTTAQKNLLKPRLPLADDKYSIAYPGVDSERFHPSKRDEALRGELNASPSDCLIGVIGRFDRQKGQLEFIQALKILNEQKVNFKAVVVGAPTAGENQNNYDKEIFDFVKNNGLDSKVMFKGFIEDPSKLMASLDIFVLPSYEETFGLVLLEAMASGTAVIATNAGGPPEILSEPSAMFAPKNPQALAQILIRLINSPAERKVLGSKFRERASTKFTEPGFVQSLLKLAVPASQT